MRQSQRQEWGQDKNRSRDSARMLHKDKKKKGYGRWIKNSKGTGPSDSTSTTTNRSGKDKVTEQRELGTSRNKNKKKKISVPQDLVLFGLDLFEPWFFLLSLLKTTGHNKSNNSVDSDLLCASWIIHLVVS
jgi:hypothetical protein